jgi:hypothetical protein
MNISTLRPGRKADSAPKISWPVLVAAAAAVAAVVVAVKVVLGRRAAGSTGDAEDQVSTGPAVDPAVDPAPADDGARSTARS